MSAAESKILFKAVEQAELVSEPKENRPPAPNEVVGRTLYSLVSAGTELNIYLGNYQKEGLAWGRLPFVPGYAASLRVESVGSDVKDLKAGDVVYCQGKHASWQRWPRSEVVPLPAGLAPEKAPFARLMNIGMSALTTTTARPPGKVVVTGLGPVGLLAAMIFDRCGYEVTAVDPVEARRRIAESRGLKRVAARMPIDDPDYVAKVPLVLDCSGHEQAILDGLTLVEKGGEVVVAGVPMTRKTEIFAQEVLNRLFRSFASIRSGKEQAVPSHPAEFRKGSQFGNMAAGLAWIADGRIKVDGLYAIASPRDCQKIYQDTLHMRLEKLATVLDWSRV